MNRRRLVLLAIAALVVMGSAFIVSTQRDAREAPNATFLPWLATDLNAVDAVNIFKGGPMPTVTLHKRGAEWTVAQRAEYPADVSKLRTLLLALRDAKIVEEKTTDPARFAGIGVDDPLQAGASGTQIAVATSHGSHAVIVGKAIGEGNFARRAGDAQSYSVEPGISVESEPPSWIDARLLDLPAALIRRIEVKPNDGAAYSLERANPADATFKLNDVPPGRQAQGAASLVPSTTFGSLAAEDVAAVGDIDFGRPSQTTITLSDGNVVTLTGVAVADKHWLQVAAGKDAALAAKARDRAFEIAGYRYDAIFRPLEQLLEPASPPPGGKRGDAGKAPAGKGAGAGKAPAR